VENHVFLGNFPGSGSDDELDCAGHLMSGTHFAFLIFWKVAVMIATPQQARRVLRGLGERSAFARPSPDIWLERFGGHPGPPKLVGRCKRRGFAWPTGRRIVRRLGFSPN
jgi:hypothetical protein